MCDYSLTGIPNRLAAEGERLVVHRFSSGATGLTSPADLPTPAPRAGWRSMIPSWSLPSLEKSTPAVCVPPGARLLLRDIPARFQVRLGVGPEEEVTFDQVTLAAYTPRDAIRFKNGRVVRLVELEEGQPVQVLCLSGAEVDEAREAEGIENTYLAG